MLKIAKRSIIIIALLLLVSPIFGVYLADMVGYHEPLDLAAESIGLEDVSEKLNWTPFLDYSVPGLPDTLGYIISGVIGVLSILAVGYILVRASSDKVVKNDEN